ncbi:hypothetical protein AAHH78_38870, partial [Burkholderia pseudomallei]
VVMYEVVVGMRDVAVAEIELVRLVNGVGEFKRVLDIVGVDFVFVVFVCVFRKAFGFVIMLFLFFEFVSGLGGDWAGRLG